MKLGQLDTVSRYNVYAYGLHNFAPYCIFVIRGTHNVLATGELVSYVSTPLSIGMLKTSIFSIQQIFDLHIGSSLLN